MCLTESIKQKTHIFETHLTASVYDFSIGFRFSIALTFAQFSSAIKKKQRKTKRIKFIEFLFEKQQRFLIE